MTAPESADPAPFEDPRESVYYDRLYACHPRRDVDFYRELAVEARGPVLELGVGSGRILLEIAGRGIPVTGLDASAAMLNVLREKKPARNVRLVNAPMQRFDLGHDRFCLVFAAFRTFQYLLGVEDQLACLACVRRHLAPGGSFAFDVFAPRLDRLAELASQPGHGREVEQVRFDLEGDTVVRYARSGVDPARQQLDLTHRYERRRADAIVSSDEYRHTLRYFFRFELEHLLARAGFRHVEVLGGFDRRAYDSASPEIVVVARADEPGSGTDGRRR